MTAEIDLIGQMRSVELYPARFVQMVQKQARYSLDDADRAFVAREAWQVSEIELAIREADAGDFVPVDEMAEKMQKMRLQK